MNIKLAGIVGDSIVDGPGLRFTIFVQGCPHNCEGCHNPETHDFNGGRIADTDKIYLKIKENALIKGVTFSGGEPFCQPEPLAELAEKLKADGYNLLSYTGFTFEQLLEMSDKNESIKNLLSFLDILIDGKFDIAKRSLDLKFKGSTNQRILDAVKSFKEGKAVEIDI